MAWKLVTLTEDIEWTKDDSGLHALINYVRRDCLTCKDICVECNGRQIRVDVMSDDCEPVISLQGTADRVRRALMRWFVDEESMSGQISLEHASYIGQQIALCDRDKFVEACGL